MLSAPNSMRIASLAPISVIPSFLAHCPLCQFSGSGMETLCEVEELEFPHGPYFGIAVVVLQVLEAFRIYKNPLLMRAVVAWSLFLCSKSLNFGRRLVELRAQRLHVPGHLGHLRGELLDLLLHLVVRRCCPLGGSSLHVPTMGRAL